MNAIAVLAGVHGVAVGQASPFTGRELDALLPIAACRRLHRVLAEILGLLPRNARQAREPRNAGRQIARLAAPAEALRGPARLTRRAGEGILVAPCRRRSTGRGLRGRAGRREANGDHDEARDPSPTTARSHAVSMPRNDKGGGSVVSHAPPPPSNRGQLYWLNESRKYFTWSSEPYAGPKPSSSP